MKSKFFVITVLSVAALAMFCMLSDDSDADYISGDMERITGEDYTYGYVTLDPGTYQLEGMLDTDAQFYYASDSFANHGDYFTVVDTFDCYIRSSHDYPVFNYGIKELIEYKVLSKYNEYSDDYTRFSLKAGPIFIDLRPDTHYENTYLIIGNSYYPLDTYLYVPYDCDDVYFYSLDENVRSLWLNIENSSESERYTHKNYLATSDSDFSFDTFFLDVGTYTFRFSRDGNLAKINGDIVGPRITAGQDISIEIQDAGEYCLFSYVNGSGNPLPLLTYYSATPEVGGHPTIDDVDWEDVTSSTTYMWYEYSCTLSAGEHRIRCDGSNICFVFFSSEDAEMFKRSVIDKGIVPPIGNMGINDTSFELDYDTKIWAFCLVPGFASSTPLFYDLNMPLGYWVPMSEQTFKNIYVAANSSGKVAFKYDSTKYAIYLYDYRDAIYMPNSVLVEVSAKAAKEYLIIVVPLLTDSTDVFTADYQMYTEGLPTADNNAFLFAALSIGLCAVFFGLLLWAGRKPKWKD